MPVADSLSRFRLRTTQFRKHYDTLIQTERSTSKLPTKMTEKTRIERDGKTHHVDNVQSFFSAGDEDADDDVADETITLEFLT